NANDAKVSLLDRSFLDQLIGINFSNNQFDNLPPEIADQDNCLIDLKNWLDDVAYDSEASYEVKLILAGNGRVGKTCVLKRLYLNKFDPEENSTHGIQLYSDVFEQEKEGKTIPLLVNAWDFGGQEVYHATHRLFMQSRALYLVVWDEVTEQTDKAQEEIEGELVYFDNYQLPYWLHKSRALSGRSPLLVVKTKIDKKGHSCNLPSNADDLQKKFDIKGFLEASPAEEKYFKRLRTRIFDELIDMPEVGLRMPSQWLRVKEDLEDLKEERTIPFDRFLELCQKYQLRESSAYSLIRYLHNTGAVFYQAETFKDKIILDQKWALEGIYRLFKRDWVFNSLKASKGVAELNGILAGAWQKHDKEDRKIFLSMMVSSELCFVMEEGKENAKYLITEYLPEEADDELLEFWKVVEDEELFLEYNYPFFHSAFMLRFIAKAGRMAKDYNRIWKRGIWITDKQTDALIEAVPRAFKIIIRVKGKDGEALLKRIHGAFKEIYSDEKEIKTNFGYGLANMESSWLTDEEHRPSFAGFKKERYTTFINVLHPEEGKKMNLEEVTPQPKNMDEPMVNVEEQLEKYKAQLRKAVENNNWTLLKDLLNKLRLGTDAKNAASSLLSRQKSLNLKVISGGVSHDDQEKSQSQIVNGFLSLIDYLEEPDIDFSKS
ncbi:MAG: COR domain-containing protein, partial [Bacteroidota bacterium]